MPTFRHTLIHIPPGRGLTHANLEQLRKLNVRREMKALQQLMNNARNINREMNVIYDRIARNGGHANRAAARNFTRPYINRAKAAHRAARTSQSEFENAKWRRLLNVGGRFKGAVTIRKQLEAAVKGINNKNKAYALTQLIRPYMGHGSPLKITVANYSAARMNEMERENRERHIAASLAGSAAGRAARMRRASPPRSTSVTRSGRTVRKPRA